MENRKTKCFITILKVMEKSVNMGIFYFTTDWWPVLTSAPFISKSIFHMARTSGHLQARSQNCEKWLLASSCLSVSPPVHKNTSAPTTPIFKKNLIFEYFFKNMSRKFKAHQNLTRIMGTLHEDVCIFMTTSRWILRMRNIADKVVEKIKTLFFFKSFRIWDNVEEYRRTGQATDDNMAHAHYMLDT
jgi:hypothetical protein